MSRGRAAVAALALGLTVAVSGSAAAQFFSPGPLARPHAALEGLEKCVKCHEEQKGLSARLCLDCHTELAPRIAKGAGFHGRLPAAKRQECQACHPDHRGLDFEMVEWDAGRDKFDHQRTGWPLKGGHAAAKVHCDDCHQRRLITEAPIRHLLEKHPNQTTFLGLSSRCDSCHFDEHRGQLGRECQKCHTETAWKPTTGFDHQRSAFPLAGKHKDVGCAKCHATLADDRTPATAFPKPHAASFMQMKPLDFKTCESCHQDPHKGSLGPACASCHTEAGWKIIKTDKDRSTAFHDKTRYPLRGGHVGVACRSCHGPFPGQPAKFKGLPFGACTDCHLDAHLGQLGACRSNPDRAWRSAAGPDARSEEEEYLAVLRRRATQQTAQPRPPGDGSGYCDRLLAVKAPAKVAPCESCHTVNGFLPPRYELEQHQKTQFPLEGAHAVVACRGCHAVDEGLARKITTSTHAFLRARKRPERFSLVAMHPGAAAGRSKSPAACLGCHEDVHRGQFAEGAKRDTCATCHETTSFLDLTFDHDEDSRFPLTGKHAQAACAACHKPERPAGGGTAVVRYKPLSTSCGSCHDDVHQGQFLASSTEAAGAPAGRGPRDCEFCHQTKTFKETLFDHGDRRFTTYALDGQHAKVACDGCHRSVTLAAGVKTIRYRPLPRACESCHVDFHHGEFRGFEP